MEGEKGEGRKGNSVDLSSTKPSPEGEGWVRESKIRKKTYLIPLIPTFSLREKGLARLS